MTRLLLILLLLLVGCNETPVEVDNTIHGCFDYQACNYNSEANIDNNSCWYANEGCSCQYGQGAEVDECGVCNGDGSSCAGSVILSISTVDGSAGTAEILMQNDVAIAGFQFVIADSGDLDLIDISGGSSAAYGFTLSSSESGTVVGFTLTGTNIPVGLDVLLVATFNSNEDQTVDLCLSDPVFSDTNANGVNVNLGGCVEMNFSNSILGDINDDGIVNVLDVVVLVNIVLGLGEGNSSADINNDNLVNVLDVVILVNMILS